MKVVKIALKKLFGKTVTNIYRKSRQHVNKVFWYGKKCKCNICNNHLRDWSLYGDKNKNNRICPVCYSFGRQRFLWYCIENSIIDIKPVYKILHIAPERCLRNLFENILNENNYITGDLNEEDVDIKVDITNNSQPDSSYDLIICLHVMEHVPDDNKALSEFNRILKSGGKLIIQVPLSGHQNTYEDATITVPQERALAFGQSDHLRLYGIDIKNKIASHDFNLTVLDPVKCFDESQFNYFAFDLPSFSSSKYESESVIFVCQKQ